MALKAMGLLQLLCVDSAPFNFSMSRHEMSLTLKKLTTLFSKEEVALCPMPSSHIEAKYDEV